MLFMVCSLLNFLKMLKNKPDMLMKKKLLTIVNSVLAFVAAALGLTGCGEPGGNWNISAEYGCPNADFDISGRVVNGADEAIEGIEVQLLDTWTPASDTTNADGEYVIKTTGFPHGEITVVAVDIDGDQNGLYSPDTIKVKAEYVGGDGRWYEGKHTGVVNFKLHAAEPTEPEEPTEE